MISTIKITKIEAQGNPLGLKALLKNLLTLLTGRTGRGLITGLGIGRGIEK
jgi:hypothetical protein